MKYKKTSESQLENIIENWRWATARYKGWIVFGDAMPPSGVPALLLYEEDDGKSSICSYGFVSDKNEWVLDEPGTEWHYWCIPPVPPMWEDDATFTIKADSLFVI